MLLPSDHASMASTYNMLESQRIILITFKPDTLTGTSTLIIPSREVHAAIPNIHLANPKLQSPLPRAPQSAANKLQQRSGSG